MIGGAAAIYLLVNGRIMGASGILGGLVVVALAVGVAVGVGSLQEAAVVAEQLFAAVTGDLAKSRVRICDHATGISRRYQLNIKWESHFGIY